MRNLSTSEDNFYSSLVTLQQGSNKVLEVLKFGFLKCKYWKTLNTHVLCSGASKVLEL